MPTKLLLNGWAQGLDNLEEYRKCHQTTKLITASTSSIEQDVPQGQGCLMVDEYSTRVKISDEQVNA